MLIKYKIAVKKCHH